MVYGHPLSSISTLWKIQVSSLFPVLLKEPFLCLTLRAFPLLPHEKLLLSLSTVHDGWRKKMGTNLHTYHRKPRFLHFAEWKTNMFRASNLGFSWLWGPKGSKGVPFSGDDIRIDVLFSTCFFGVFLFGNCSKRFPSFTHIVFVSVRVLSSSLKGTSITRNHHHLKMVIGFQG